MSVRRKHITFPSMFGEFVVSTTGRHTVRLYDETPIQCITRLMIEMQLPVENAAMS